MLRAIELTEIRWYVGFVILSVYPLFPSFVKIQIFRHFFEVQRYVLFLGRSNKGQ